MSNSYPEYVPLGKEGRQVPSEIALPELQSMATGLLTANPGSHEAMDSCSLLGLCEDILRFGHLRGAEDYQDVSWCLEWRERCRWKANEFCKVLSLEFPSIDDHDSTEIPVQYATWDAVLAADLFHHDEGPFPQWSKPDRYLAQAIDSDEKYKTKKGVPEATRVLKDHVAEIDARADGMEAARLREEELKVQEYRSKSA